MPSPTYGSFDDQAVTVDAGAEYGLLELRDGGGIGHIVGPKERDPQLQIAAKVAILFLGISLAAITVIAIQSYPTATSTLFSVYGSVAGLSLVFLALLGVEKQRGFSKPAQTAAS